jgi:predicted ArsR family transcriptional regulator
MELTTAEKETLVAHTNYVLAHGYPPTLRALAAELGIHWTAVRYRLTKMREKGALPAPRPARPVTAVRIKLAKGKP